MDIKNALKGIGLAENDAKVYLALLDLGSAKAGEITKKSGVNRTNVYDSLDKLIEKGLVSFIISSNRKYFEATEPEKIIRFLELRQEELDKQKENIRNVMPEIELKRKLSKVPQEATIYKGRNGLKSVAEDTLLSRKELLIFGAEGKFVELFGAYAQKWHERRVKLAINLKIVYNNQHKTKKKFRLFEARYNNKLHETPATTWVYGDKTAIIVWAEQPIITLIRSKDVAKSNREFFNILWGNSKKYNKTKKLL